MVKQHRDVEGDTGMPDSRFLLTFFTFVLGLKFPLFTIIPFANFQCDK